MGKVEDRINALAEEVADGMGLELVDVALLGAGRRTLLRITIDREGGVTVGECGTFSRDMGALLDVEDHIRGSYALEVTSPGLDRPMKNARDFGRHLGKLANVTLKDKVEGRGAYQGTILEALDGGVVLSSGEGTVEISYENIRKAKLEIEIK